MPVLAASSQSAPLTPIHTQAELRHYLRATPIQNTPLGLLPPTSRKRFLAELTFHPHGIGINYNEPAAELTHPQIVQLYALFDQPPPFDDMGLTPTQQQQRKLERIEDARRRGCAPAQCPESEVEQRFDQLSAIKPYFSMPDAQRFAAEKRDYDHLFGSFFRDPDTLRNLGDPDLRLLTRALKTALYAVPDAGHVAQLRQVLEEMQRRGMTSDADFEDLYAAEISTRQFTNAATLRSEHPGMHVAALPTFIAGQTPKHGLPTALSVDVASNTMRRQAFDLDGPLRIVIIAGCHFSQDAARAIEGDAQLRPLFARHSIWLAMPSEQIGDVSAWNRQFPDFPMHVAWNQDEWSMLPSWGMPTYYVYRNGQLVKQFSGWLGTAKLKRSLHEAGAL
jgi:hypothetical protein